MGGFVPALSKPLTIVAAAAVGITYLAALVLTGELGKEDLGFVRSIARTKTAAEPAKSDG